MSHEEGEVTYPTLETLIAGNFETSPLNPGTQYKGRYVGTDRADVDNPIVYVVNTHLEVYKFINNELASAFEEADPQDCRIKVLPSGSFSVVLYGT